MVALLSLPLSLSLKDPRQKVYGMEEVQDVEGRVRRCLRVDDVWREGGLQEEGPDAVRAVFFGFFLLSPFRLDQAPAPIILYEFFLVLKTLAGDINGLIVVNLFHAVSLEHLEYIIQRFF